MHLLLLLPSSLLLLVLLLHSWRYRGRKVTLAFFGLCFAFGVLRGNVIHYIITDYLGGETLPYQFLRPVVKLWNASLQECIGWIFALYLSWSLVEWVLAHQGKERVGIFRLIGLAAFVMGAISYAVETAAAGVKWWVWVFPIGNHWFADVPFEGIVAWISVVVDFLGPFLLVRHGVVRGWKIALLPLIFPLHMLTHLKTSNVFGLTLPVNPSEIWYWVMLSLLAWGVAFGGPEVPNAGYKARNEEPRSLLRHAVPAVALSFLLVLVAAHLAFIRRFELTISLAPFVIALLFFRPWLAAACCGVFCLAYAPLTGQWGYLLGPLVILAVFALGGAWPERLLPARPRRFAVLGLLLAATVALYLGYRARYERTELIAGIGRQLLDRSSPADEDSLLAALPSPPAAADAFHYNRFGMALIKRDQYAAGTGFLERAVAADSTYAYAYINLAWARRSQGDYQGAIELYRQALALNPVDFGSYLLLGEIYLALDRLDETEALYRKALEYDPRQEEIILALEGVLYRQGRIDEALALLRDFLPEKGDTRRIESRLAADLFKAGRSEEAVGHYRNLIREDINHLYASAMSLALIHWRDLHQPAEALNYLNLLGAIYPTADVFTLKGQVLEELGKRDEAHQAYRRAAELAGRPAATGAPAGN